MPEYCSVWRSFAGTSINRESNFFQKEKKKKKYEQERVPNDLKNALLLLIFALRLKYCVVWIKKEREKYS